MNDDQDDDPATPEDWQAAVDAAELLLAAAARGHYRPRGGSPPIDPRACRELLARGRAAGFTPRALRVAAACGRR